jgi:RNA polymerase sigma-70 factor (ECF subfamily)
VADISSGPASGARSEEFNRVVEASRRELHAHCYRMLGAAHDADDAVQETLLKAWRGLDTFAGRGTMRSWLYTVATRTCLDQIVHRSRRALPIDLGPASGHVELDSAPRDDVPWLGPYPDTELRYEQREAVELAFVAAMQHLPGNQRAALLLFDVLGYPVAEIADMMDTTATSVNSALARARRVVAEKVPPRSQQETARALGDARVRETVAAFASAFERRDPDALVALLTADVTWAMPPLPHWYAGRAAVRGFAAAVPMRLCPHWMVRVTTANGQPAVAFYVGEDAHAPHDAWSLTVLTLREDGIAGITSFLGPRSFPAFRLPVRL